MAIANNAITELKDYGVKQFRGWTYASVDRAANDGVAAKALKEKNVADPTFGPCHSHANNLPGKEFNDYCKLMSSVRNIGTKVFAQGEICIRKQRKFWVNIHLHPEG